MHIYECTNKGTQMQEKTKHYNTRYKRKVIIIILKNQDYILLLFALFI